MTAWTVLSIVNRDSVTTTAEPVAAIERPVNAYGYDLHTSVVQANTADEAITMVREAFRVAGTITPNTEDPCDGEATRWTVIGLADNGVCASHNTIAVVAGEHEVEGHYASMLAHRWVRVVDAFDAQEAEQAGYKAAAEQYEGTWD